MNATTPEPLPDLPKPRRPLGRWIDGLGFENGQDWVEIGPILGYGAVIIRRNGSPPCFRFAA